MGQYRRQLTTLPAQLSWVLNCGLLLAGLAYAVGSGGAGTGKPISSRLLFQHSGTISGYLFPVRFVGMVLSCSSGGGPPP